MDLPFLAERDRGAVTLRRLLSQVVAAGGEGNGDGEMIGPMDLVSGWVGPNPGDLAHWPTRYSRNTMRALLYLALLYTITRTLIHQIAPLIFNFNNQFSKL